jgi:hypothetical protein
MQIARSIWFAVALASLGAIYVAYDSVPLGDGGTFILVEFGLFAIAFMATLLSGRPGRVLVTGAGLGFLFACVAAIVASGTCSEGYAICFSPGEVFGLVLVLAAALYPGWALGAGVGNLVRGTSAEGSNR